MVSEIITEILDKCTLSFSTMLSMVFMIFLADNLFLYILQTRTLWNSFIIKDSFTITNITKMFILQTMSNILCTYEQKLLKCDDKSILDTYEQKLLKCDDKSKTSTNY